MNEKIENNGLNPIRLKGSLKLPSVILDSTTGEFEISGRSLPNDTKDFYDPIIDWLTGYEKESNDKTIFSFKLEYFNSSSSMMILAILLKLKAISVSGKEVLVNWYSEEEDILEAGLDYADAVDIPFEHIEVTSD